MARFSDIIQGTAATREADVEFLGGKTDKLLIRVLSGEEEAEIAAWAHAYVADKGAKDSDDLYELASYAKRVALGCMDIDAPTTPYFESVEQLLGSAIVGRDRIVYLGELQLHWQDQCSPSRLRMSEVEFAQRLHQIAGSDQPDPFVSLRPGMRWIFARTTARALLDSQKLKSDSGGPSASTSTSTEATQ
jgi:hypothetical protein